MCEWIRNPAGEVRAFIARHGGLGRGAIYSAAEALERVALGLALIGVDDWSIAINIAAQVLFLATGERTACVLHRMHVAATNIPKRIKALVRRQDGRE
ncbi:hypothetical protein [Nocardia sp. R7R-8]|uniref:hypothetical protein n=1 Tax=Nocardia sp. R7R-8 TaxID=3459304 RepID=UPI00403D70AB